MLKAICIRQKPWNLLGGRLSPDPGPSYMEDVEIIGEWEGDYYFIRGYEKSTVSGKQAFHKKWFIRLDGPCEVELMEQRYEAEGARLDAQFENVCAMVEKDGDTW